MDIPTLSMELSQSRVLSDVGTAVLSKSLDMVQDQGAAVTDLIDTAAMELSVNPDIGANIDISV